jgi:tRNA-splicing ligase RtcB
MGEPAVILEGVSPEKSEKHQNVPLLHYTLFSTVHGAGRVLGRNQAKRTLSRDSMTQWVQRAGVTLRGGDVDESPECYKRLDEVLRHQGKTVRILHTLKPIGVAMAGRGVVDPYKD